MMEIVYISLLTFGAVLIGTITGFGTSTLMIPILALFIPITHTIILVAIIHLFSGIWKVSLFITGIDIRFILLFGIPGIITSYIGALLLTHTHQIFLVRLLGIFLCSYAIFMLLPKKIKFPTNTTMALTGGTLSGFFVGVFGIGGAIRSAFLTVFNLPKEAYIATMGAIGLVYDITRLITYFYNQISLPTSLWYGLVAFIPISFIAAFSAKYIVSRVSSYQFQRIITVFLFLIGLKFILFPY